MNNQPHPIISRIEFDNKDILEIGCGSGGFTLDHLLHAKSILGLDKNSDSINSLKKQWPEYHEGSPFVFQVGDIINFPLDKKEFDIAIFSYSF